jgi:hypothetical protein
VSKNRGSFDDESNISEQVLSSKEYVKNNMGGYSE